MNRMFSVCAMLLAFLLPLSLPAQSTREKNKSNQVVSTEVDTMRTTCQNLLIAGFGTIPVRHFMENLSPHLIDFYKPLNINGKYEFMGKDAALMDKNLNAAIAMHRPDMALVIYELPDDLDTLTIKSKREILYQVLISPQRRQRVVNPRRATIDKQLQALLWVPASSKVIWRGELSISGSPAKNGFFQEISRLLTNEFHKYQLLVSPE